MAYNVTAKRGEQGWELHVDGAGAPVDVLLNGLEHAVEAVRARIEQARSAQRAAAAEARKVATDLRRVGLPMADTAVILGLSKGRVSQLVKG